MSKLLKEVKNKLLGSKRDVKAILKAGAKAKGISLAEYRKQFQENIYEMKESDDPEIIESFKKYFGDKIPTPEEYIYKISKAQMKKIKF